MIRKSLLLVAMCCGLFIITGCDAVDDILGKVNQILDNQLAESDTDEAESNETVTNNLVTGDTAAGDANKDGTNSESEQQKAGETGSDTNGMSDGHENEADPQLSFEERFLLAGYEKIDPPNGLSVPVPLDWILIQVIKEDPAWEGAFCFATPMDETIAKVEEDFRIMGMDVFSEPITSDLAWNVHSTKYYYEDMNEKMQGDLIYYADDYGTSCVTLYVEYIFD